MNEHISRIIKHPVTVPASVGVGAFAIGVTIGYFLGRRKFVVYHNTPEEPTFEDELDGIKHDYETFVKEHAYKPEEVSPREPVVIDAEAYSANGADFVKQQLEEPPVEDRVEIITTNVFADTATADEGWDYDEEVKARTPSAPYILHKDEFYADEKDFTQVTVTYYEGDNIMSSEDDTPVYNHETIVGPLRFGHGSGDPNVFYARNEKLTCEYEVLRDPGLYSVEVLGLQIENNDRAKDLKHSNSPGKFRGD